MITLLISSSSDICVFKKELQKHCNFVFIVQRFTNTFQVLPLSSASVVKCVAYLVVTQRARVLIPTVALLLMLFCCYQPKSCFVRFTFIFQQNVINNFCRQLHSTQKLLMTFWCEMQETRMRHDFSLYYKKKTQTSPAGLEPGPSGCQPSMLHP